MKPEGNAGNTAFTFRVTRTGNTSGSASANYATTGSGANPANATDFGGSFPSGTVSFAAGETTRDITVNVSGDTDVEPDETFTVTLSSPVNATIGTATATGTIQNDDAVGDYAVTLSGGVLTITDLSGNGDVLTMSQSGTDLRFGVAPSARTYTYNGGPVTPFSTPADVPLSGITAIMIQTQDGNDTIQVAAFTATVPALSVNGGKGNDVLQFNGDLNFLSGADLDADLQNDDPNPGTDQVSVVQNANLLLSGTGKATLRVSRQVSVESGASVETVQGNLTIEANQQSIPTGGSFVGVTNNGQIRATGSGTVTVKGRGGNTGDNQHGVLQAGGRMEAGSALLRVEGTGGASTGNHNYGVHVLNAGSGIGSTGGILEVKGIGGGSASSASNHGVSVILGGEIFQQGSGKVSVEGFGGSSTGNENFGVYVRDLNSRIASQGGEVEIKATGNSGGNPAEALRLENSGALGSGNNADLRILANSVQILGTPAGTLNSGTGTTIIQPQTAGTLIVLGGADILSGSPLTLGLTDAELDRVTAGRLVLGAASSGDLTVNQSVTRSSSTITELRSGGDIEFLAGINTGGGSLLLAAGNAPAAVVPTFNGTDATAGTMTFSGDMALAINGTAPGDGTGASYVQLNAAGTIDLSGVDLVVSGSYTPIQGDSFLLVSNDGVDPIIGTFTGLPEGSALPDFLGSGLDGVITYAGGSGNDVVIRMVFAYDFTITDPCTCNNDASPNMQDGTFGEVVTITGPSGVNLVVANGSTGLLGVSVGDVIPESPAGSGNYLLAFDHADGLGYNLLVAEDDPSQPSLLTISNLCHYPVVDHRPGEPVLRGRSLGHPDR